MSQEKAALLMFKGVISDLPAEEKEKVDAAKAELQVVLEKHGDTGILALQWMMLEMAAED